jgi:hypothetical protein
LKTIVGRRINQVCAERDGVHHRLFVTLVRALIPMA